MADATLDPDASFAASSAPAPRVSRSRTPASAAPSSSRADRADISEVFTELVARVRRARYELTDEEARVLRSAQSDMWQRALTVGYAVGAISHGFIGATMPSKPTPAARFGRMGASVSLGALAAYAGARSLGRATLERVAAIENSALAAETRDVVRGLAPDDPAGKDPPTKPAPAERTRRRMDDEWAPARRLDGDADLEGAERPAGRESALAPPAAAPPVQSAGGHLISAAAARKPPPRASRRGAATRPRDDDDDDASVVASRVARDDTAVFWRVRDAWGASDDRDLAREPRGDADESPWTSRGSQGRASRENGRRSPEDVGKPAGWRRRVAREAARARLAARAEERRRAREGWGEGEGGAFGGEGVTEGSWRPREMMRDPAPTHAGARGTRRTPYGDVFDRA